MSEIKAVLIYAQRKSGSTLLQNLLDGTNEIIPFPGEFKFKFLLKVRFVGKIKFYEFLRKGTSLLKELDGQVTPQLVYEGLSQLQREQIDEVLDVDEFVEALKDKINERLTLKEAIDYLIAVYLNAYKSKAKAKYIIFKEVGGNPNHVIALFRSLFPNGLIIFNQRDAIAIANSIVRDRLKKRRYFNFRQTLKLCIESKRIESWVQKRTNTSIPNQLTVHYNDFVADTESTIRNLCTFLNIPYHENLTQPTLFGFNVRVRTASKNEKKVFRDALSRSPYWGLKWNQKTAIWFFIQLHRIYEWLKSKY